MLVDDDCPGEVSFPVSVLFGAVVGRTRMGVGAAWVQDFDGGDVSFAGTDASSVNVESAGSEVKGSLGMSLLEPGASPDGGTEQGNQDDDDQDEKQGIMWKGREE